MDLEFLSLYPQESVFFFKASFLNLNIRVEESA